MKTVLIIDGQGGGFGRSLVEKLKTRNLPIKIRVAGINSVATNNMLKAGATLGATGENAVVVACQNADVIAGPIGIILENAMLGECTEKIAKAVVQSKAIKVLVPVSRCGVTIAGTNQNNNLSDNIEDAVNLIVHQICPPQTSNH